MNSNRQHRETGRQRLKLKKLHQQVIVITGASSGIGLVTARLAARRGATVVLASRSDDALRQLREEITAGGGEAASVVADVTSERDVERVAEVAIDCFGGFDTWVNNAGVTVYGKFLDVAMEDLRQVFETNFWGLVYGSLTAARHLRHRGGALINVGSTLSDRAIPIQGMYSASKHAVKGFTDALRMELESEGAPISVTLVKPSAIDTPYTRHAKNYMDVAPTNPPPVYSPEVVANAILHCAVHPQRDVFAGGGGKLLSALGNCAPRLVDRVMERRMPAIQRSERPRYPEELMGLYEPAGRLEERGDYEGHVAESSLYTRMSLHPVATAALAVGAGLTAAILWSRRNPDHQRIPPAPTFEV